MLQVIEGVQGVVYRLEGPVVDRSTNQLMPNANETLEFHCANNTKTGIVSSEYLRQEQASTAWGLPTTDAFVSRHDLDTEEVEHGLTELYEHMLGKLQLEGSEVMVIETGLAGVRAARNAGCLVIGLGGAEQQPLLEAMGANLVALNHEQANRHMARTLIT